MPDFGQFVEKDFSGVVSVLRDDKLLFRKASGYSDISNRINNEVDTRFATASAGKFFVAIAIMRLIERGRLALSDTIGDLLDFDLKSIDPNITILQL